MLETLIKGKDLIFSSFIFFLNFDWRGSSLEPMRAIRKFAPADTFFIPLFVLSVYPA